MDNNDIIVCSFLIYVVVASIIFVLYIRKIFRECAVFEPTSEKEFKRFYRKQLFKAFSALVLLFAMTLTINYVFKPGEIIDMMMKG